MSARQTGHSVCGHETVNAYGLPAAHARRYPAQAADQTTPPAQTDDRA